MNEYTREMIGNCRRWIKDLTDDSVNETLCADEFAGLLDDALDEIEHQQARITELEAEIERLTVHSDIERQDDKSPNDTQKGA